MAYSKAIMQAGSITYLEPFIGQWIMDINSNLETGFHLLLGISQQVTGLSWLTISRYFPGIIFMMTVLSVYTLAQRQGFGWEAAFFTCLIPTSVGILGPAFMVPMATGLLFIPLSLFLAFNFKTWPSHLLLFIFTCFLLSMHAPTAIVLFIILIPCILLNIRDNFRHSLGLTLALAIPFIIPFPWIFQLLLPTAGLLPTAQPLTPWIELPLLLQNYGYLPVVFGFLGIISLALKGGKKNFGLIFGLLALLLVLVAFYSFHYGLAILFERGLTDMLLILSIIAGAGLLWIKTIKLPSRSKSKYMSFLSRNLGNVLCPCLIVIILAVSIPSRLNTSYYHLIDQEDYNAFTWIKDNVSEGYDLAMLDPWKATAFTAITDKKVCRRIYFYQEPVDQIIYNFLHSGCSDTAFLKENGISMLYNRWDCNNPNLIEVRKNVYLTNPNLSPSLSIQQKVHNQGFGGIYNDSPGWWHPWSLNCTPIFSYPEPGRGGGSSISIKMSETEPFAPWPVADWLQNIPVEAGRSYYIGGWIKTESIAGWGGAMIIPHWKGTGYTRIDETEFMSWVQGTNVWTYYEGEVTAPAGATICTLSCTLAGCSGTAWYDDIVFIELTDIKPLFDENIAE